MISKVILLLFFKDFENDGSIPKGCNFTFVTLIPKTGDPFTLSDFRPISLVSCQYKILAKLLTQRLKNVLPDIISECQSAFISG